MLTPIRHITNQLRRQDHGFLSAVDYILLTTIVMLSSIVGLATVRDAVIQQLGDASVGLESLQQTYTVNMTFADGSVKKYGYVDDTPLTDPSGSAPAGISLTIPADHE